MGFKKLPGPRKKSNAYFTPQPDSAPTGLLQSTVVPKGPTLHQQAGGSAKKAYQSYQGSQPEKSELLGETKHPRSLFPRTKKRTVSDMFYLEGFSRVN